MILIVQYPLTGKEERVMEYTACLQLNLDNPYIHRAVVFIESREQLDRLPWHYSELLFRLLPRRMTYADAVNEAALWPGEVCIIANADIAFDESLSYVTERKLVDTVICLSRQDMVSRIFRGEPAARVSQDAWIFVAPLRNRHLMNLMFELGRPGCDNRVAHEFGLAYKLVNPARIVKCHHHHGGIRAGTFKEGAGPVDEPGNMERDRIPRPYKFVPITEEW
jgi:hypothetical protein